MTDMPPVVGKRQPVTRVISPEQTDHLTYEVFAGGTLLVTSFLEVTEPTEIHFAHDRDHIHISAQYFLEGEALIVMGDGGQADWTQDGTSVIRSDTPGFRLRVEPGQRLRHICVAMVRDALHDALATESSALIERLMATGKEVNMAVPVPTDSQVRAAAESLYALRSATGTQRIKAEGLAMSFLSEVLEKFAAQDAGNATQNGILPWQARAIRDLRAAVEADPGALPSNGDMLDRFKMGEQMARRLFQAEYGLTLAAFARETRMNTARAMLSEGKTSVKAVAFESGYGHVGNFSRAYRQQFGETPSETRKRAAK